MNFQLPDDSVAYISACGFSSFLFFFFFCVCVYVKSLFVGMFFRLVYSSLAELLIKLTGQVFLKIFDWGENV